MRRSDELYIYLVLVFFTVGIVVGVSFVTGIFPFLAIPFVFLDISLTYYTYKLLCKKHLDADPKKLLEMETNRVLKTVINIFGMKLGGLLFIALATAFMTYMFLHLPPFWVGFLGGIYAMVILTHLANILDIDKMDAVDKNHFHIATCCKMANGED